MGFSPFVSESPGRICLFGEHQDYLGFPVIAAAIPLTCRLVVQPREDGIWSMETPALSFTWSCHVDDAAPCHGIREPGVADFLQAGLSEALQLGWEVRGGGHVLCSVDLPTQAGCSSSTALVTAWMNALARVAGKHLAPLELAQLAHQTEVLHFQASGGWMDHVACALGGVVRIHPGWEVEALPHLDDGVWILADSGQPKDTHGHLDRCKGQRLELLERLGGAWLDPFAESGPTDLSEADRRLWQATWRNAQLERQAAGEWHQAPRLAGWMMEHHVELRDGLLLSTPTLERMGQAAMDSGAWGWKVVGSGGGGCMIAWCPSNQAEAIHVALRAAGAHGVWTVSPSAGARCIPWEQPEFPLVILAAGRSSRMKRPSSDALNPAEKALIAQRSKAMLPVGPNEKPFLAFVLERARSEGVDACCLVLSSEDALTEDLIQPWIPQGLTLDVARQTIPNGRSKPWGTADAVSFALRKHPEWGGLSVGVCNGDNLPPQGAFEVMAGLEHGMVGFARTQLGLPQDRVEAFAVADLDEAGEVVRLIEKPSSEEVQSVADPDGEAWVSMNLFRLNGGAMRKACEEVEPDAIRQEKELPSAALLVAEQSHANLRLSPCRGAFVDLTHPEDWKRLLSSGI